ncbi:MAG TPA: peptidase M16 [Desulfonatronum sp.]|nr:peptidase M16 [Desulfonatronum sp.]
MAHDFEPLHVAWIAELHSTAHLFKHRKTGARFLSLVNDDENKVFGITFRTPPDDSTGIAHILEHSVLCGSRKYPVKEPFVELLKGSLQTFLNAFTYPDKTCYPVASQNLKDFYNLIDVYLDAVFYPRLTSEIFAQEGWHYKVAENGSLSIQGVVYNEMKGAYASPDGLLAEYSQQSLFPETAYGLDSGGHPEHIPNLTHDQFLNFHRRYYHPSNAFIFFSGDDDPEYRLEMLSRQLRDFEPLSVDSGVKLQSPFPNPRRIYKSYPVGHDQTGAKNAMLTLNWVVGETTRSEENLAWQILEYLLIEMPSSPLRKALIDSGLGEDLAGTGLEAELRQMFFSTGLRGMHESDAPKVEALVRNTLETLVQTGIPNDLIQAALNSVEFRLRERNSGRFPRGLAAMLQALTFWLYDADPLIPLAFEAPLERLRVEVAAGRRIFEDIILCDLLNNTHHSILLLTPDPELGPRMEHDENRRLAVVREQMDKDSLHAVLKQTEKLRIWQETPDAQESLTAIPCLSRADLEPKNKHIPKAVLDEGRMLFHDQFTSRIVYLDLGLNLRRLSSRDLPFAPLLAKALVEIGTQKEDFARFATRISQKTGGIWPETFTSPTREPEGAPGKTPDGHTAAWLFLRGKVMVHDLPEMLDIFRDMLLLPDLGNKQRFLQLLLEEKAGFERVLVPKGHLLVNTRLRAGFSPAEWAAEQLGGISYLFFLRSLIAEVERNWDAVSARLRGILASLLDRDSLVLNVTTQQAVFSDVQRQFTEFLDQLPTNRAETYWPPEVANDWEGLRIQAPVNYVGKGARMDLALPCSLGSAMVVVRYLRTSWLWEQVRVKGGAYGAFCLFDVLNRGLTMVSYRDPHILRTLNAFDASARYLRKLELSEEEVAKAVVGAVGDLDAHQLPDAKGHMSLRRHLTGQDDAFRQQIRDQVLATTARDFRAFADVVDHLAEQGRIVVMGGETALSQADPALPRKLHRIGVL